MNANYGYGDYHVVLDYIRVKGEEPRSREQMRKDINVFLRELRKEYRKAGKELKYIHVMEIGEKGARHHHLVINQIDTKTLQECWYKAYEGHNRVKVSHWMIVGTMQSWRVILSSTQISTERKRTGHYRESVGIAARTL